MFDVKGEIVEGLRMIKKASERAHTIIMLIIYHIRDPHK